MFCSKCGQKLKNDAVFCPNCGTKVERNRENMIEKSHRKVPVGLIAGIVIAFFALTGLILGVRGLLSGRDGLTRNDLDKERSKEQSEELEAENLWEEAEKLSEASQKTQAEGENADHTEGEYDEEREEIEPNYMNPEIARAFGHTKEEVIELFGEPDMFYEKEGSFPRELIYGDIDYMMVGESDVVNRISGPVEQIFDPEKGRINTLDDIISLTGSDEKVDYYVDEGIGDWSHGRGVLIAVSYIEPYNFAMSYRPDRKITSDQWVTIDYTGDNQTSSCTGERLKGDEVEPHVREIRERYNNIVQNCNEGNEQSADVEIEGEICQVTANLNEYGEVMRIFYQRDGDKFWLYYDEYAHLEFAYVERADGSAERWYFFRDKTFRVRCSADANKPDDSYNYENDELIDFLKGYQEKGWNMDLYWMERGALLRQQFEK